MGNEIKEKTHVVAKYASGCKASGIRELDYDASDTYILRWLVISIVKSKKKEVCEYNDKLFFWVLYDQVIRYYPFLKIKKPALINRFNKYIKDGILERYAFQTKNGGKTYYRFTQKGYDLLWHPKDLKKINTIYNTKEI